MSELQRQGPVQGGLGTPLPFTCDFSGGQRTADAHARFMDAVIRGNVWLAANQAGSAITNLVAAATGLILTNPAGSGKILSVWEIGFMQTSAAAAAANAGLQLAANVDVSAAKVTQTTPLVVRNALLGFGGGSAGAGLAASSVTLPAVPVAIMNLWQPSVSATATTAIPPVVRFNLDGAICLMPNTAISLSALSALSGAAHIIWEEIPLGAAQP